MLYGEKIQCPSCAARHFAFQLIVDTKFNPIDGTGQPAITWNVESVICVKCNTEFRPSINIDVKTEEVDG